ncbi:MAG: hypothetical protein H0T62_12385 [Parachlamydiaceae bacterium]|nr:hypothetical protein [Parachlamydiaceae bacterium]
MIDSFQPNRWASCVPVYISQDIEDLDLDDEFQEWIETKQKSKSDKFEKKSELNSHDIDAKLHQQNMRQVTEVASAKIAGTDHTQKEGHGELIKILQRKDSSTQNLKDIL